MNSELNIELAMMKVKYILNYLKFILPGIFVLYIFLSILGSYYSLSDYVRLDGLYRDSHIDINEIPSSIIYFDFCLITMSILTVIHFYYEIDNMTLKIMNIGVRVTIGYIGARFQIYWLINLVDYGMLFTINAKIHWLMSILTDAIFIFLILDIKNGTLFKETKIRTEGLIKEVRYRTKKF